MKFFRALATVAAMLCVSAPLAIHAQDAPRIPRIFIEDSIASPAAPRVAEAVGTSPVAIGARVAVALPRDAAALTAYLEMLRGRNVAGWIAVEAPAASADAAAWQGAVRALFANHAPQIAVLEVIFSGQDDALRRFVLQVAATEGRARGSQTLIAIGGDSRAATGQVARAIAADTAPYVDVLVIGDDEIDASARQSFERTVPTGRIMRRGRTSGEGREARTRLARDLLMTVGTSTIATAWVSDPGAFAEAVRGLVPAADLVRHQIEPMDAAAAGLAITQAGRDVAPVINYRLLFDEQTFATYLFYEGAASAPPLDVSVRTAVAGLPVVLDLATGERVRAAGYARDEQAGTSRATVPLTGRPMLVNFSEGAETMLVDRTGVSAERQLTVDEVIARHRQYQARHDAVLQNYRASVRMEQHFRPTLTDPGWDVITENEYFVDDTTVEWEERSFSVNGSKWGSDRPPFPLLQPEKVLSLPLQLRLDQDYRYTLDGIERVGAFECYRVRFEPATSDETLYRGTVWIDRRTFARVKTQAVQTRTSAPVVANEEIHTLEPVISIEGFPLFLLTKLTARQTILIAGRNLLLEKAAVFSDFRVNTPDFVAARDAVRQGDRIMYRDTDRGVRYLVKDGERRVVSERATASAKAMAMGVLVDPSFAFPLPIFGINYLDFEFRGRPDTQFALLFGGVLAAGNLQRPKLGGTPLDASVDFFAIAAPASDRLHTPAGELEAERLLTWPLSAGANLGWQYTAFQKAQLQYQFRYDAYVRDRTTAESFVVPSSTITNGIGGGWEYKRGGYSIALNGTFFARGSWTPWGPADALEADPPQTYTKYAAHVSRDFFFNVFHKIHVNASYFGGERLDRFSRYQFGLFDDTRIHGVPASGVRFDNLGMLRGSYSFNIFEQYRLDLFAEQAWGRDRSPNTQNTRVGDPTPSWQPLTGLGLAVNLRAPWNTILRADFGKSLLPDRYDGVGSTVFQIMLLKPLSGR